MNFWNLKEYQEDRENLAEWVPWGGLIHPSVVKNKDGSLLGVLSYRHRLDVQDVDERIAGLVRQMRHLTSGWALWMEQNHIHSEDVYYLTLLWYPPEAGSKKEVQEFTAVLKGFERSLAAFFDVVILEESAFLSYLSSTVSPWQSVNYPEIPLYLDALFTQDVQLKQADNTLIIDGRPLKIITPLSWIGQVDRQAATFLKEQISAYRIVQRFLFFDEADAKQENERYLKRWCQNRSSIRELLTFGEYRTCGYYTFSVLVYDEGTTSAEKVRAYFQSRGYPAVLESYHFKDVWLGTLPGQFRANINPPMVDLLDISILIAFPN